MKVGLSIRLWLADWRSILCCLSKMNAWADVQEFAHNEHQRHHTRLDLCAHCLGKVVSTDALAAACDIRCLRSMVAVR